jgi:transcriptional regulator of acetoin/glycerol metabolism
MGASGAVGGLSPERLRRMKAQQSMSLGDSRSSARTSTIPPAEWGAGRIVPLAELERRAIVHALGVTGGNVTVAAERLGIGRATLYRKVKELGLTTGNGG